MKKITLLAAVAALAAGSATAATPRLQQSAVRPHRMMPAITSPSQLSLPARQARLNAAALKNLRLKAAAADVATDAGDDVVVIENTALYVPAEQAFYMGLSPQYYSYNVTVGLTGIRNRIGFYNLTEGADSQKWLWREPVGVNETQTGFIYEDREAETHNLMMELKPEMFFASPELTAKFGDEDVKYTPKDVVSYFCGGSLYDWNWAVNPDVPYEDLTPYDQFGAGMAAMLYEQDWIPYSAWILPSAGIEGLGDLFTETGTFIGWDDFFSQATDAKYENAAVTGFTTVIPTMPSPYQMGHLWLDFMAEITADMELTATIYPLKEEGIDYEHPLGRGSVILTPGEYPTMTLGPDGAIQSMEMPVFEFYALDSEGYETDLFPCIYNTPVAVTVSGFNKDNAKYFSPFVYGNSICTREEEPLSDYMFPTHAYVNLDVDYTPKAEGASTEALKIEIPTSFVHYPANEAGDSIYVPSDYGMFFNVEFPTIVNVDTKSPDYGTANFRTTFEAAGGEQTVTLFSSYIIVSMLEEGLMTASYSAGAEEWLSYEARIVQESPTSTPYQEFDVTAKPLPEGVKGRQGYILFSGLACDFAIVVTQGEVAGISDIKVVPVAKGTQYFDLQGRRLTAAPAAGLYIERNGDKAVKRIAR